MKNTLTSFPKVVDKKHDINFHYGKNMVQPNHQDPVV